MLMVKIKFSITVYISQLKRKGVFRSDLNAPFQDESKMLRCQSFYLFRYNSFLVPIEICSHHPLRIFIVGLLRSFLELD
jgi:hypothetical protein